MFDLAKIVTELKTATVITPGNRLNLRTWAGDGWHNIRVPFISHELMTDVGIITEVFVYPDSVQRGLQSSEQSQFVKMGLDLTRNFTGEALIHLVPRMKLCYSGGEFERTIKPTVGPYEKERISLDNPYLLDWLHGYRDADGALRTRAWK